MKQKMEQGEIWKRRPFRPPVKVHPRLMSDEFVNHLRPFDTFRTKLSNQLEEATNYSNEMRDESKFLIENRKEIIIKIIFFLVSFTALAFNVSEMSVGYFGYSVISEVLVTLPEDLEHPSMTLCTAYHKLIDKSKLEPKEEVDKFDKGGRIKRREQGKKVEKSDLNVTISQIFEFTPSESELIVNCSYRKPGNARSFIKYSTHCDHALSIVKYVQLHQICYKITYQDHDHKNDNQTSHNPVESNPVKSNPVKSNPISTNENSSKLTNRNPTHQNRQFFHSFRNRDSYRNRYKSLSRTGWRRSRYYREKDSNPDNRTEKLAYDEERKENLSEEKSNGSFKYHNIKYHIMSLDSFLQISLNASLFSHTTSFVASIFSPDKLVRGNDVFNVQIKRGSLTVTSNDTITEYRKDYYFLSFQRILSRELPAPYTTNCITYNHHTRTNTTRQTKLMDESTGKLINDHDHNSRQECIDHCVSSKVMSELYLVPFTTITLNSSLDEKLISEKQLKKCSFRAKLKTIETFCINYCVHLDCKRTLFVTKFMRSEIIQDSSNVIKFRIMTPVDADIKVEYYEVQSLLEYIAGIFSCLGIWLGFCILDSRYMYRYVYRFAITFFKTFLYIVFSNEK